jgi:hypothetical protein
MEKERGKKRMTKTPKSQGARKNTEKLKRRKIGGQKNPRPGTAAARKTETSAARKNRTPRRRKNQKNQRKVARRKTVG